MLSTVLMELSFQILILFPYECSQLELLWDNFEGVQNAY